MAAVKRAFALAAFPMALVACGKLQGFGGAEPPLVTFDVTFSGDLTSLRPPGDTEERSLQVTLIWGLQWLQEPFCVLPPESAAAAAVIAAGCRDPLSFVPNRVDTSVPVSIGETASLPLLELPTADLMVGDITARVAYGSLVVYDDRDGSGTLELSQPHPTQFGSEGRGGGGEPMDEVPDSADVLYGASFLTMTAPDQRVAYREGGFDPTSAFYPRSGCTQPPPAFSVLGAGGFTLVAALAATAAGGLPPEDPTSCSEAAATAAGSALVSIAAQAPADVDEVDCDERTADSSTRYHEPPADAPDLTERVTACAHLPSFDAGTQSSLIQFVVSGRATDRCKGLTHYTLRGCRENVSCAVPDWDLTASPPSWWSCPN
jgi:hypothetical protein